MYETNTTNDSKLIKMIGLNQTTVQQKATLIYPLMIMLRRNILLL